MWILEWLVAFTVRNTALITACGVVFIGLLLAAIAVVKTGKSSVYLGAAALLSGAWSLFAIVYNIQWKIATCCAAILWILGGITYLFAFCGLIARGKALDRKARQAEIKRRLQYVLPDRENTFVQARMNSVLRACDGENFSVAERADVGYARKMLSAVLEMPLSAGERLQAEDVGKMLSLYMQKERWSVSDLRAINDAFSVLLKLCAKYSVAV